MKTLLLTTILLLFQSVYCQEIPQNTTGKVIYLTTGRDDSTNGNGSKTSPYESLLFAIQQAQNGDTIQLLTNINYTFDTGQPFVINKAVTIDGTNESGENFSLQFRGMSVALAANVTFKNLILRMLPDSGNRNEDGTQKMSRIYVSDYEAIFDNVSTKISNWQTQIRPVLVAGNYKNQTNGTHAKIIIKNATGDTEFEEIIAGDEDNDKTTPTSIEIADRTIVKKGILFASAKYQNTGKVRVYSESGISKFSGVNATDSEVVIVNKNLYNVDFNNIRNVFLVNSTVSINKFFDGFSGTLNLDEKSMLIADNNENSQTINIGTVEGKGTVRIKLEEEKLKIGRVSGIKIEVTPPNYANLDGFTGVNIVSFNEINNEIPTISLRNNTEYRFNLITNETGKHFVLNRKSANIPLEFVDFQQNVNLNSCQELNSETGKPTTNKTSVILSYSDSNKEWVSVGKYQIVRRWKAVFESEEVFGNQTITILDTESPKFKNPLPQNLEIFENERIPIQIDLEATDNCDDVTVSKSEIKTENSITYQWIATDFARNQIVYTQVITIKKVVENLKFTIFQTELLVHSCKDLNEQTGKPTTNKTSAILSYSDSNKEFVSVGKCQIVRRWKAVFESEEVFGNQTITILDTESPKFKNPLPQNLEIFENERIPIQIDLEATDTCGDVTVSKSEVRTENTITYQWTAIDFSRNQTVHTQVITIKEKIEIPISENEEKLKEVKIYNGVSSLSSSENFLRIENIELCQNNNLKIFNEIGIKVYEMDNYQANGHIFRGISNITNKKLPQGVYFYIFSYSINGKITSHSGYLLLL